MLGFGITSTSEYAAQIIELIMGSAAGMLHYGMTHSMSLLPGYHFINRPKSVSFSNYLCKCDKKDYMTVMAAQD